MYLANRIRVSTVIRLTGFHFRWNKIENINPGKKYNCFYAGRNEATGEVSGRTGDRTRGYPGAEPRRFRRERLQGWPKDARRSDLSECRTTPLGGLPTVVPVLIPRARRETRQTRPRAAQGLRTLAIANTPPPSLIRFAEILHRRRPCPLSGINDSERRRLVKLY